MARQIKAKRTKKTIYVFWEGESEEAYTKFLKEQFALSAVIKIHAGKGTFDTARAYYRGNARFQRDIQEIDEIWFFFDTEVEKANKYDEYMSYLESIVRVRRDKEGKKKAIKIRLLMTTGCIEYWLLLHYEKVAPSIVTAEDKQAIMRKLQSHVRSYTKGDLVATKEIAKDYETAVDNGKWTLYQLEGTGLPSIDGEDTRKRDGWLFRGQYTFTTVHEAIEMLKDLPVF